MATARLPFTSKCMTILPATNQPSFFAVLVASLVLPVDHTGCYTSSCCGVAQRDTLPSNFDQYPKRRADLRGKVDCAYVCCKNRCGRECLTGEDDAADSSQEFLPYY